jgi:hypothetical protein
VNASFGSLSARHQPRPYFYDDDGDEGGGERLPAAPYFPFHQSAMLPKGGFVL